MFRTLFAVSLLLNLIFVSLFAFLFLAPFAFLRDVAGFNPLPLWYEQRVSLFEVIEAEPDSIVFLGDSITDQGRWAEVYPDLPIRNLGIGGDTTKGVIDRLDQVITMKPAKLFLMIGTNDVGTGRPAENIIADLTRILDRLTAELPNSTLYVQSLLPRQPEYASEIIRINLALDTLTKQRGHIFLDLHEDFSVEGGTLNPAYTNDDLHLLGSGYQKWHGMIDLCVRDVC